MVKVLVIFYIFLIKNFVIKFSLQIFLLNIIIILSSICTCTVIHDWRPKENPLYLSIISIISSNFNTVIVVSNIYNMYEIRDHNNMIKNNIHGKSTYLRVNNFNSSWYLPEIWFTYHMLSLDIMIGPPLSPLHESLPPSPPAHIWVGLRLVLGWSFLHASLLSIGSLTFNLVMLRHAVSQNGYFMLIFWNTQYFY